MKFTMVVPSYWRRNKAEGWKSSDTVYDHPTPLDEEGTLVRLLESLDILDNKDFELVVLGVANAPDIQDAVEEKLMSLIRKTKSKVEKQVTAEDLQDFARLVKILPAGDKTSQFQDDCRDCIEFRLHAVFDGTAKSRAVTGTGEMEPELKALIKKLNALASEMK